jgi:hypothetical protein
MNWLLLCGVFFVVLLLSNVVVDNPVPLAFPDWYLLYAYLAKLSYLTANPSITPASRKQNERPLLLCNTIYFF